METVLDSIVIGGTIGIVCLSCFCAVLLWRISQMEIHPSRRVDPEYEEEWIRTKIRRGGRPGFILGTVFAIVLILIASQLCAKRVINRFRTKEDQFIREQSLKFQAMGQQTEAAFSRLRPAIGQEISGLNGQLDSLRLKIVELNKNWTNQSGTSNK